MIAIFEKDALLNALIPAMYIVSGKTNTMPTLEGVHLTCKDDNKCYIEDEITDSVEIKWLHQNCHRYGFILRYPFGKEDITKYSYEPWHFRYVGDVATELYNKDLTLEEYLDK